MPYAEATWTTQPTCARLVTRQSVLTGGEVDSSAAPPVSRVRASSRLQIYVSARRAASAIDSRLRAPASREPQHKMTQLPTPVRISRCESRRRRHGTPVPDASNSPPAHRDCADPSPDEAATSRDAARATMPSAVPNGAAPTILRERRPREPVPVPGSARDELREKSETLAHAGDPTRGRPSDPGRRRGPRRPAGAVGREPAAARAATSTP